MLCHECGSEDNPEGSRFCGICGSRLEEQQPRLQVEATQMSDDSWEEDKEPVRAASPAAAEVLCRVVAVFAYEGSAETKELSFEVGQEVEVLKKHESGWWVGRIGQSVGLFPSNRVKEKEAKASEKKKEEGGWTKMQDYIVKSTHAFHSEDPKELSFEANVLIDVVATHPSNWWLGKIGERQGLFPSNRTTRFGGELPDTPGHTRSRSLDSQAGKGGWESITTSSDKITPLTSISSHRGAAHSRGTDDSAVSAKEKEEKEKRKKTFSFALPGRKKGASASPKSQLRTHIRKKSVPASKQPSPPKKAAAAVEVQEPSRPEPAAPYFQPDSMRLLNNVDSLSKASGKKLRRGPDAQHGYVLAELITTEKDFLLDLRMLVENFILPLRTQGIVGSDMLGKIFSNLHKIIPINEDLMNKLEAQSKLPMGKQDLGAVFLEFSKRLDVFTEYCANTQQSGEALLQLHKTNPAWRKFLQGMYQDPCMRGLKLDSYLIKPIQRVCRYPLLIQELIRTLPKNLSDSSLVQAREKFNAAIEVINETRRENENYFHAVELQSAIAHLPSNLRLVAPGRRFIREALFDKLSRGRSGQIKRQRRKFFMFNDCLVYAKPNAQGLKAALLGSFQFKGVVMFNMALVQSVPNSEGVLHAFDLIRVDKKKKITVCCTTNSEKEQWMTSIEECIEKHLGHEKEAHMKKRTEISKRFAQDDVEVEEEEEEIDEEEEEDIDDDTATVASMTTEELEPQAPAGNVVQPDEESKLERLKKVMLEELEFRDHPEGRIFNGRCAITWVQSRFDLPSAKGPAMELMNGLLRSGIIVSVLDNDSESFHPGFTSFYRFA